jgi:peptidyl-prolyl cis-trans isomerase D
MLSGIRKHAGGWVTQIFLGILVISFAVWGVADIFRGFRADSITRVGSTDITARSFAQQYDIALRSVSRQIGRNLTPQQAQQFGIPSQVLSQLVSQATLDDAARRMNLGISNPELARQIAADPTFKGPSGTFDRNYFSQVLRANGYDENHYVADRRQIAVRQQIGEALVGGAEVPTPYLKAFQEFSAEQRAIAYLILPASVAGAVPEPTDAELTAYFEANKAAYKAPEYRALSVIRLTPADIAKPEEVSDEDAKKSYDANLAKYTAEEQRKISQIVFTDQADADKAAADLAAGKTFDDLAAARNLKPGDTDLGLITRDHFADMTVGDTAFSLPAGSVSGVINGQFGPVILRVDSVQPKVVKTFDEVKAELKQQIATQRAAEEITNQHDMIEDERAGGATLAETAAKYGLKPIAIPAVDATGKGEDGKPVADLPGGNDLVNAAFQSDVGIENDPIQIDNRTGWAWYEVTNVTPARDRQLSEVKDRVVADWKEKQVDDRLVAKANEIRDRLAKGEQIASIAAELSLQMQTADKLTRNTQASELLPAAAVSAAFDGPKGYAAVTPGTAPDTQIVLLVTDSVVPPFDANGTGMAEVKKQLGMQIANDVLAQYIAEMQNSLGVTINQAALQQVIQQQQPGA